MQIDIVTPSLNQRDFLAQTLCSVLDQQGDFQFRHIVVDGGSTDGSVDLLKTNQHAQLTWTSEKDAGQSDAVNKGLAQCTGDIVGWLNSDDVYLPGAFAAVAQAFTVRSVNWVIGRYQVINERGEIIRPQVVRYKDKFLDHYSYRKLLRENFIAQPSVFWRRAFGEQIGKLDQSLYYTMDYDLWLRMGKASQPKILPQVLSQFRIHPTSKSGRVNREQFDEGYRVACRYFGDDKQSKLVHKFNVEKIVWAYRLMCAVGK